LLDSLLDPSNIFFWILILLVLAGAVTIISRPFSSYIKFVYPNAKFEAMGNPYISKKELESVIESKDIISFKETVNSLKDYMNDFYDVYLEKQDIPLIKDIIISKIKDNKFSEEKIGEAILPKTKQFLNKIYDAEKVDVSVLLKEYGFDEEVIESTSKDDPDFLVMDTKINKYIINRFKQTKVPYKCEDGKQKFVKTLIDLDIIKNILRGKQLGYDEKELKKLFIGEGREIALWKFNELTELETVSNVITNLEGTSYYDALKNNIEKYNQEKSVQVFETVLDETLLKIVREISTQNYTTIGPSIRFLVSKEFEIKNLKIIAKGVGENLSSDIIKSYLTMEVS
jgi:V/A-type H+-transporting ATPase subunit C